MYQWFLKIAQFFCKWTDHAVGIVNQIILGIFNVYMAVGNHTLEKQMMREQQQYEITILQMDEVGHWQTHPMKLDQFHVPRKMIGPESIIANYG